MIELLPRLGGVEHHCPLCRRAEGLLGLVAMANGESGVATPTDAIAFPGTTERTMTLVTTLHVDRSGDNATHGEVLHGVGVTQLASLNGG